MAYKLKSSIDSLCSGSAAKMNAKKGDGPVYNLSGKKGLQPSNNPAAAYMTGSPAKHEMGGSFGGEVKHSHNNKASGDSSVSRQPEPLSAEEKAYFDTSNLPTKKERLVNEAKNKKTASAPKPNPKKVVASSSNSNQPPPLTSSDAAKLRKIKANKNKNMPSPEALTSSDAVKLAKINQKNKASEPKEMSRKQIRAAKQEDKLAGMSRKQVRANKLKRKADSAKAKTNRTIKSIDPTKAKSADTGAKQTKAKSQRAKTIRLQKRVARLKGKQEASKIK